MVMTDGQEDPDKFINEVFYLRDKLVDTGVVDAGEVFKDDSILNIVLEGLTDEECKLNTPPKQMIFTLDGDVITMHNMYAISLELCDTGLREKRRGASLL